MPEPKQSFRGSTFAIQTVPVIVTLEPTYMTAWRSRNIGIGTLNTGRYRYSPVTPLPAGITGYPVTGTSLPIITELSSK